MRRVRFFTALAAFPLCLFSAFTSCTRSVPEIAYWYTKLVYQETEAGILPSLSFFVMVNDEDGPEDFDELRLYNDKEGLMWKVNTGDWLLVSDSGKTWIGSKMFRQAEDEAFPSGRYRAVIIDKAREQGEKYFGFDIPADSPYRFPTLKVEDGNYTAVSAWPENYILMFYVDGAYKTMTGLNSMSGSLDSLRLPADVFSIALWGDDKAKSLAAITKRVSVREIPKAREEPEDIPGEQNGLPGEPDSTNVQ